MAMSDLTKKINAIKINGEALARLGLEIDRKVKVCLAGFNDDMVESMRHVVEHLQSERVCSVVVTPPSLDFSGMSKQLEDLRADLKELDLDVFRVDRLPDPVEIGMPVRSRAGQRGRFVCRAGRIVMNYNDWHKKWVCWKPAAPPSVTTGFVRLGKQRKSRYVDHDRGRH